MAIEMASVPGFRDGAQVGVLSVRSDRGIIPIAAKHPGVVRPYSDGWLLDWMADPINQR